MNALLERRCFLTRCLSQLGAVSFLRGAPDLRGKVLRDPGVGLKLSLNAYSFNDKLTSGATTLEDLVDVCARHGLDALDPTGYYFVGYPNIPSDETIYRLKRKAYVNGINIGFIGLKNDFTLPDLASRKTQVRLAKDWIEVASKLGAPMIRVFTGPALPKGYSFDRVVEWMIPHFQEIAEYGRQRGVVVALQNHEDFLRTADQVIRIVGAVNSEWFGSLLDVGSLRLHDPYEEIEKLLPYAVSWLLKEHVWYGARAVPTDVRRLRRIIEKGGYRGYLSILTLDEGDPTTKVAKLAAQARAVFSLRQ
jgi:sugar phosphate isomerase/epimerase